MSETTIQFDLRIGGVLTDATPGSVVLSNPAGTFGVRRLDTLATVVAAGTPLVHISTGVYRYSFTDPAPNLTYNYYVQWEYGGNTYNIEQDISGNTGGGVAPSEIPDALPRSCISLARYAFLTGYSECAISGVNNPTDAHGDCENPIWTEFQRNTLLRYLSIAQSKIEKVLKYPLCPTYYAAEEHIYRFPLHTDWVRLIAAGIRAESDILASAAIDYSVEPARIGPLATSVTDPAQVKLFYPGSEREIEPSKISISGGNVTLWVPRCRMVHPDFFATPEGGLEYDELSNFLDAVDVKRVYTDTSVNASLVYAHRETVSECVACGCFTCGEALEDGCLYVRNPKTGAMDVLKGSFSGGVWTANCSQCHCTRPDKVRVNYLAGLTTRDEELEDATIRLAHTLMPVTPCGCDPLKSMWERDNKIPEFRDNARLENPWGDSDGALYAYRMANLREVKRAGVL